MKKMIIVFLALLLVASSACSETIKDIFPDENVARYVRDEIGALSVDTEVTDERLDRVWLFANFDGYAPINDLTGMSRLRNASFIRISNHWGSEINIDSLPAEITSMVQVTTLELNGLHDLTELPENIGNLTNLEYLTIESCGITSLPDSVCSLSNLKTLSISGCPITKLPENIGNLANLTRLDISDTRITELPQSISNLMNLESFNRGGTPL